MAKTIEMWIEDHKLVARSYNEDKPGTPIIFIHGITSSVDFWESLLPAEFKERYRYYSLALPGHYPAVMPPAFREENLTAEMIARVLSEALYRLAGTSPAIVIGHSTGGFAALHLAAHAPGIVKGVVSVSGFAQGKWTGVLGMNQAIASIPLIGNSWFKSAYWLLGKSQTLWTQLWRIYAADAGAMYRHPVFKNGVETAFGNYQRLNYDTMAMYFRRMPRIDISAVLAQIRVPVLLIAGDKDPIVPTAQSQMVAQKIADSELALIAGAGHVPMLERTDEYNRVLMSWLEKHA